MKKLLILVLSLMLALVPILTARAEVVLTMGSWRISDVEKMNKLLAMYKERTGVQIDFQPASPQDYDAALRMQLDSGTGPDLMYAHSYTPGLELFEAGYFADCSDIPALKENFSAFSLAAWQSYDGKMFAVPLAAVSHAVYYNKDLFAMQGIEIPATFEDFLALCEKLKTASITPLANGMADEWDILECLFLNMLPNYVGGAFERVKYETGEKKMNDEAFVTAFTDIGKLDPYLPEDFASVTYKGSQTLFTTGKAAMFMDGSWTLGTYGDVGFNWGVFAMPAPKGRATVITFHPDMAIAMNTKTKYPDEAKAFLAWLCTQEGVDAAAAALPAGFFPLSNLPMAMKDEHAAAFLALNTGKETDASFIWPELYQLYDHMNQAVIQVLKGEITPQQAADNMAKEYDKLQE